MLIVARTHGRDARPRRTTKTRWALGVWRFLCLYHPVIFSASGAEGRDSSAEVLFLDLLRCSARSSVCRLPLLRLSQIDSDSFSVCGSQSVSCAAFAFCLRQGARALPLTDW